MKEWTRFFAAMLTVACAALCFEQLLHLGNPLGAAVGAGPLLLGVSTGAGLAVLLRRKSLEGPQLESLRRRTLALVAGGFAGLNALAFGLLLFIWFAAYLAAAPFPWAASLLLLAVSAAAKGAAIAIGVKGMGHTFLRSATAVGAASMLTLVLMALGGPLLTLLAVAAGAYSWHQASKEAPAPPQKPPVDAGPDTR